MYNIYIHCIYYILINLSTVFLQFSKIFANFSNFLVQTKQNFAPKIHSTRDDWSIISNTYRPNKNIFKKKYTSL